MRCRPCTGPELDFVLADTPASLKTCLLGSISGAAIQHRETPEYTPVPIAVTIGGRRKRYVWTASGLSTVDADALVGGKGDSSPRSRVDVLLRHPFEWAKHEIRHAFFPHRDEVYPDYWTYAKWRAVHRFFSSMNSVFATQSLLQAVGIGAQRSLPAAATINWVLKDGLGRLGRLSVATQYGASFDADLKRFRFGTSILYCLALALEYATPLAPSAFLPLASLANVGKSVGLATYVATQPAFHKSFARGQNLADISAKSQGQQMVLDNLGLAVAVLLTHAVRASEPARSALPLVMFPLLVIGDLTSIYQEMRSIHLRSLNRERAEILAASWLDHAMILTPQQVSRAERLLFAPAIDCGPLPLEIGGLESCIRSSSELEALLGKEGRLRLAGPGSIHVALRSDASARDALQAVVQAALLRRRGAFRPAAEAGDCDVAAAAEQARVALAPFLSALEGEGWQTDSFLLSRGEKARYTMLLP
ncbi:UPF0420 protein [Auxenochlorella protothecoides]|uniref:UPF0420 protein n=1 Tax=Auxenochlorella protothecoides TaxID=3075 RepID=A0A087SUA9_AUXPR|nr:UPF0420 protein [Auxenochlorella protothecoides]KFM29313.1 UPF0420 protein [Auxenochlorella protothecoides]